MPSVHREEEFHPIPDLGTAGTAQNCTRQRHGLVALMRENLTGAVPIRLAPSRGPTGPGLVVDHIVAGGGQKLTR